MSKLLRYAFMLLALGYGVAANGQMTFALADMYRVNATQWRYGTVTCTNTDNITSIILSMINNQIASNSSGITPTQTSTSLGTNPRTVLYLFTPGITPAQVASFVKGMTFTQTTDVPGANPYVNISVDANPSSLLPAGAKITAWNQHPDGSPHYYVWVAGFIQYGPAYNAAKSYYFQGMRGYLPSITSFEESALLTNISSLGGWSGGARTPDVISDTRNTIDNPSRSNSGTSANYRWLCGPETDFYYTRGPASNGVALNGAFSGWNTNEPNDASGENCMQVNHTNLKWNDINAWNAVIQGYFIEFGGNGKAYTVGAANYPANPNYDMPTLPTTNHQWHGFSPGNRASTSTTFKPNAMRANVLVIE